MPKQNAFAHLTEYTAYTFTFIYIKRMRNRETHLHSIHKFTSIVIERCTDGSIPTSIFMFMHFIGDRIWPSSMYLYVGDDGNENDYR